jgi:hypothetical protein
MANTLTTFDPQAYRAEMIEKHSGKEYRLHPTVLPKRNDGYDDERARIEDEVVASMTRGQMKGRNGISYTFNVDEKGNVELNLPLSMTKTEQNKMRAEAQHYERKCKVLRRLHARAEAKGLEHNRIPPLAFSK